MWEDALKSRFLDSCPYFQAIFGIDILVPHHFGTKELDLVVSEKPWR